MTAIFTAAPVATYDIALKFCLKADSIQPNFFGMNKLLIGKCYNRLNNPDKAKEYWNQAANVAPNSIDNRKCIEEAKKLLSQIK